MADAKPEDIQDLLGGALFKALYKWMIESGPVYLLPTGGRAPAPSWGRQGAAAALLLRAPQWGCTQHSRGTGQPGGLPAVR